MDKLIFFDIDHTLINTDISKKLSLAKLAKILAMPRNDIQEISSAYAQSLESSTDFRPEGFAFYIQKRLGVKKEAVLPLFYADSEIFKAALYPEVKSCLKNLSGYRLGIFSEGFEKFQKAKLALAGIDNYFAQQDIFVYRRKLIPSVLVNLPRQAVYVDDNRRVVETLNENGLAAIWLNRTSGEKLPTITTIHNLSEMTPDFMEKVQA